MTVTTSVYLRLTAEQVRLYSALKKHPAMDTRALNSVSCMLAGDIAAVPKEDLVPGQSRVIKTLAEEHGLTVQFT